MELEQALQEIERLRQGCHALNAEPIWPSIEQALKVVKLAGYRVSKPRQSRKKDRVGPTFVARFADGNVIRMSTYCESDEKLDWTRGQILAQAAWQSRKRCTISPALRDAVFRMQHDSIMDKARLSDWCHYRLHSPIPPAITECWFERDGVQLVRLWDHSGDGVQLGAPLAQAA